jgi:STIP1 family protein 1
MKAYYYLAQAEIAIFDTASALLHAKEAHRICVEDGVKGQGSLTPITELVLRCKKLDWERRENIRLREKKGLLLEMEDLLSVEAQKACEGLEGEERAAMEQEYGYKADLLRNAFEVSRVAEEETRRKKPVPDWVIDGISFTVMVDPVVVSEALP